MRDHAARLGEQGLPLPPVNSDPKIDIENEMQHAVA
jgi:hypothetical protein